VSQSYRLRITRNALKLRVATRIPARLEATSPILLDRTGGIYTFSMDVDALILALAYTFQPIENVDQEITSGPTANVNANSATVRVNQTVGGAITLTLPLAVSKTVPVLIFDWKGDAGTNNITITLSGAETFPGGLTTWTIAGDGGSVFLRPITGVGYAL